MIGRKKKGAHFASTKEKRFLAGKAQGSDEPVAGGAERLADPAEELGEAGEGDAMLTEAAALEPDLEQPHDAEADADAALAPVDLEVEADAANILDSAGLEAAKEEAADLAVDDPTPVADPAVTADPAGTGSVAASNPATKAGAPKHSAKPPKHASPLAIVAALLAVLAAGGYGVGVWWFGTHFLPNTTLNGEDVSMQEVAQVAEAHGKASQGYELTVTGQGLELQIKAAEIDLHSDGTAYVRQALEQVNPWLWPAQAFTPHSLTAHESITFDQKKLDAAVAKSVSDFNKTAKQPVDATAVYKKDAHCYEVVEEVAGTAVEGAKVGELASSALLELEPTLELGEDVLVQPKVLSDDPELLERVDNVNARLGATQQLMVGDKKAFEVGPDLIAKWVSVSADLELAIDRDAITTWARGELSDKLDSVGKTRDYTRPDGKQVRVSGGSYGWSIDGATLASQIADNIEAGKQASIDIPMLQTAEVWSPGGQDWGKRFIDIDITEQHVRLYDAGGSLIWESDCVTGNSSEKHDTPQGVYQLNSNKEKGDVVLEGPIDEKTKKPEYVSHVTYWMPFIWNSVALHDATWRYSFGGTVYQANGSHGCVNLPYDKAEQLFGLCEVGDVVVVHS